MVKIYAHFQSKTAYKSQPLRQHIHNKPACDKSENGGGWGYTILPITLAGQWAIRPRSIHQYSNTLRSITKENSKGRAGIEQIK